MKRIIFAVAFFALVPSLASAATLTLGGSSNVTVGDTFSVPVFLSTAANESANAVSASISYPSQLLTLVAISKAASIITLWPQDPSISGGVAQFEGVILNPGWSGAHGTVVTLTFQVKASGTASLAFTDASVLANDGQGTPILSGTTPKSIAISAAPAAPITVPPPPIPVKQPVAQPPQPAAATTSNHVTVPPAASLETQPQPAPVIQGQPDVVAVSFLATAIVCLLLIALWYLWLRFKKLKRHSARSDRTHRLLHEQFSELKASIIEEVESLERVRTKRELAQEEHFIKSLKSKLDEAERIIKEDEIDTASAARSTT